MKQILRWLLIFLLLIVVFKSYQYFTTNNAAECIAQNGVWDSENNTCDLDAKRHCTEQGYHWDEEGNRCLVTNYRL
jgi:hypothetical protein